MNNKDDKYYRQIYLEECQYQGKKGKKNKRQTKGKIAIHDSYKTDENDENYNESIE